MPTATPSLRALRWLRKGVALGGVALVLALSWLSVDGSAHVWLHATAPHAADSTCEEGHDHDGDHADHPGSDEGSGTGCAHGGAGAGAACDDPGCAVVRFAAGATDPFQPQLLTGPSRRFSSGVETPSVDREPDRTPLAWPAPSCGPPARA